MFVRLLVRMQGKGVHPSSSVVACESAYEP